MKRFFIIGFSITTLLASSCIKGQTGSSAKTDLTATEFASKIKELPDAAVVDVRTPGEFSKGHIRGALNVDWNGEAFKDQIETIDKSEPVFVYCLSGSRSAAAANEMRRSGFKEVYELEGGIMKWRSAGFEESSTNKSNSSGMTRLQYDELLKSDKLVLVDFYAEWCAPCKKMKPYLEEIGREMTETVKVVRIDADDNQSLFRELNISALPVLHLYKDGTLIWSNVGYIDKDGVVRKLNAGRG